MMRQWAHTVFVVAVIWLVIGVVCHSSPVRRTPDLEARRRSAIDRSLVRFGRSYPAEPSAADIRESLQRPTRRGNSFLRLGRSQTLPLTTDDLISLLKAYDDDYEDSLPKRASTSFLRLGRDPKFIRLGRSAEEEKNFEQSSDGYPQRKNRARDHFVRLGRDSEELGEEVEEVGRTKRSAECQDCH